MYSDVSQIDQGFLQAAEQRINKVEALVGLMAFTTFEQLLCGAYVALWIDNSAAEGSLNKGYSPERELAALSGQFWLAVDRMDIRMWFFMVCFMNFDLHFGLHFHFTSLQFN